MICIELSPLRILPIVASRFSLQSPEFGAIGRQAQMKLVLLRIAFKRAPGPFCAKLARLQNNRLP